MCFHQPAQRRCRIVEQPDQRPDDSRRLCGGTSVDMPTAMPLVPFSSRFGSCAGSSGRLVERAVEVRHPIDRALPELGEQHLRSTRQPRLGVAHRGERLRVVLRAPVAVAVDDRIAVRERLRHVHHGLVAGRGRRADGTCRARRRRFAPPSSASSRPRGRGRSSRRRCAAAPASGRRRCAASARSRITYIE
jgi:hypothetical protein